MEEEEYHGQSPTEWGSLQDLTLWSSNDPENSEESVQNFTAGTGPYFEDIALP